VASGTNLHDVIAKGKHEGMPAWSADLTADQIDALVGFILSPGGSKLFTQQCGNCHETPDLVAGKPLELKSALESGTDYPPHASLAVPVWTDVLSQQERTTLLNFLVAPDGQRLYTVNCLPCHGSAVAFSGDENQLRDIISKGGMHLEMPPWKEKLSNAELDILARYVVDPKSVPEGQTSFQRYCANCHGERVPAATDVAQARETIASGGAHQTMPVWGNVLTAEQLNALVSYTLEAAQGNPLEQGQQLFAKNCSPCHGQFGEGGPNPARPNDIIAPISTAEFLKTRDDYTLRQIIAQGQPNNGMSPFGLSYGGPLDDSEVDAIVTYLRSLEISPPVELPTEVASSTLPEKGPDIFKSLCAQCHGSEGQGGVGPALSDTKFQAANTDQQIFDTIDKGHKATPMIAWGEILSSEQITELVKYIRQLKPTSAPGTTSTAPTATPPAPTFADVMKLFDSYCTVCHGDQGGWDATSYQSMMTTGDHQPVIIPGDVKNSLLAQKLLNTQAVGGIMPPIRKMSSADIQVILDWIAAGAPEK
jgi:mono/diheme cytochrome c family protein